VKIFIDIMTYTQLEKQLLSLNLAEKAEFLQLLTKNLNPGSLGITKTPEVCGGEARIAGTRIPVWGLVEAKNLGITEAQLLQDYPHIHAVDLVNAWAYAEAYAEEVEVAIKKNQSA